MPNWTPDPRGDSLIPPDSSTADEGLEQVYEGKAPATPGDPLKGAISYPTNGGAVQQWSVALQQWV